ncbi:TRAP transporter small permease subunit [Granulosicoccus sp. 3-233]|uniref:TRAP transporter small permease subunit n=1 Tax=Granulosicoccus sp. 3-233 TaxID=3417969 RepID=UPI003D359AF1
MTPREPDNIPSSDANQPDIIEIASAVEFDRDGRTAVAEAGWLGRLIDRGGILFSIGIVCSMLILIQEIVLRYVFGAPTIWAHETTVFLCALAFIYGGLYCTARDQHIRVVLLYDHVKGRARRVLDVAISIVSMIASLFFAWAAWIMVKRAIYRPDGSLHFETSGSAWDPTYPAWLKLFLLATLSVMALQFLILAWNHARKASMTTSASSQEN